MATAKKLSRDILEFSPGLLVIQDSPPPKMPRTILYSVATLFGILLVWSLFGQLDVVASAEGRLVPETYVKIVQPADSGIVREILVHEGQTVDAGQVLIRMDPSLANADERWLRLEFELKQLQLRRIDAELSGKEMVLKPGDSKDLYDQIARQLQAHKQAYLDTVATENAALEKAYHDLKAAQEILYRLEETLPVYKRNVLAFDQLAQKGYYSELAVEDKKRELLEKQQELKAQKASVASLESTVLAGERRLDRLTSSYRSNLQDERVDAESQFNRLREELQKLEHKSEFLALKSPQKGIIKDMATHTIGTVVSPGTVLVTLVPHDESLQAEVYIKNEDVGFVHEGQEVKLKLAAYPFQKYGMITGTLVNIGADSVDLGGNSTDSTNVGAGTSGYKALIRLNSQNLTTTGGQLELTPGMQLSADIHLGYRTVMEYLLSPIRKVWLEAGKER
ncbi:HlyD family type I secretion periplasmic adaptor subunit [Marinobacterium sp. D7]|uniref:HlyD family type I secretion periplasmic adaptor subunit n=1 Tax=Marinobacterium ramblicola TaxID=2849041 RepID=UPI001C2D7FD6|nr:HlyD family type I secretion periplasmic adaptor subunit [Marinobacterium ramblicola]MBV1786780.1 HlyD family type I secretion periplasmic adaptor subunit [Marinobacterium ramblicola]